MRQIFPLLALVLLLYSSCEKEEIDNTDKNFPIELNVVTKGTLSELNWTKTNISTFEEYIVVRSTDSIPTGLNPGVSLIVTRIDDFEETNFVDNSAPFEQRLFYKVYVVIGDRFLESPSLEVNQNILSYDFVAEKVIYDEVQDVFFLAELSAGRISRFDVASNSITHTISGISNFRDFIVGDNGNVRELYVSSQSNGLIEIYNATNLSPIDEFSVGREVYTMATNNRGLLFFSTGYTIDQLRVFRRSDFLQRGSSNNNVPSSERRLVMVNEATNELVEATSFSLYYYKFSDEGELLDSRQNGSTNGTLLEKIAISPDKQSLMPYRDGDVFNINLVEQVSGGSFASNVGSFSFNNAGDQVIAGFLFFGFVQSFSFPDFFQGDFVDVSLDGIQFVKTLEGEEITYVLGWKQVGFENISFIRTIQF